MPSWPRDSLRASLQFNTHADLVAFAVGLLESIRKQRAAGFVQLACVNPGIGEERVLALDKAIADFRAGKRVSTLKLN